MVAPDQVPIRTDFNPPCTIPTLKDAQAVQVTSDPLVSAPEPPVCSVVVVALPKVPICTDLAPVALSIAVQSSVAVEVDADAPVTTPNPLGAAMHAMVVVVFLVKMPVGSNLDPLDTSPAPIDTVAVQVPSHSLESAQNQRGRL